MNSAIKQALHDVRLEENRLANEQKRIGVELKKLRGVRRALEQQAGLAEKRVRPPLAPNGMLADKIVGVLNPSTPLKRGQIIDAIRRTKYPYSLTNQHMTKTLLKLLSERRVKRIGEDSKAGYVRIPASNGLHATSRKRLPGG